MSTTVLRRIMFIGLGLLLMYGCSIAINTAMNPEITPEPTEVAIEPIEEVDFYLFDLPTEASADAEISENWVDIMTHDGNIYSLHEVLVREKGDLDSYLWYHLFENRKLVLETLESVVAFNHSFALLHNFAEETLSKFDFVSGEATVILTGVAQVYDAAINETGIIVMSYDATLNGEYVATRTVTIEGEMITDLPITFGSSNIISFTSDIVNFIGASYTLGSDSLTLPVTKIYLGGLSTTFEFDQVLTERATYIIGWGTLTINDIDDGGTYLIQAFGKDLNDYLDLSRYGRDGTEYYQGNRFAFVDGIHLAAISTYSLDVLNINDSLNDGLARERYLSVTINN